MSQPWHGSMINMLRVLVDDNAYEGSYKYSDPRLIQVLTTAAMYVCQDIKFTTNYNIDVVAASIDPDPYINNDRAFQNMVVLKAACIMDHGLYREKALLNGLEARCGPAVMKVANNLSGFKDLLLMGPCSIYDKLKKEYTFSGDGLGNMVHFILSPFVGNDFDPQYVFNTGEDNYRMVR